MNELLTKVLIPSGDHGYREAVIVRRKVIYNPRLNPQYVEWHDDENVMTELGDTVIETMVAE